MNYGSKGATKMTAGVDIGDNYSYLFVLDNDGGEVVEEGRLRTTPRGPPPSLRLRTEDEDSHRGRHPLELGKPSARRVRSRGTHSQSSQDAADLRPKA